MWIKGGFYMTEKKDSVQKSEGLSRRAFLGSMGAAAAVAAVGLTGCAPAAGGAGAPPASNPVAATGSIPNGYQCASDWLGEAPVVDDASISETIQTDVLVIGGGLAGIQAALAAAEGGVQVHVAELASEDARKCKGNDIGHFNSQWMIDRGHGPFDEGEILQEFGIRNAGRANPEMARLYIANSGEMFDHFISLVNWPDDRIKLNPFSDPTISPLDPSQLIIHVPGAEADGPVTYPISQGGFKSWSSTAQFMGEPLHEAPEAVMPSERSRIDEVAQFSILKSQELGAVWRYGESGIVLVQDASKKVIGAITQKEDGSYVKYETSVGVILTTGDIGGNPEMAWALNSEVSEWAARAGLGPQDVMGFSTCKGDGQKMACWAGGLIEPTPRPIMNLYMPDAPWGTTPYILLNAYGKRFMNEAAVPLAWSTSMRQPAGILANFTDSNWLATMKKAALDHGAPNFGRSWWFDELEEDINNIPLGDPNGHICRDCTIGERQGHVVYGANTLDELAELLGYTGEAKTTALAEIEHYNELCRAGEDSDFSKDSYLLAPIETPPFYGASWQNGRIGSVGLVSLTGVMTDNTLQVVNGDNQPIGGLWAAGNCLGDRYGLGYATPIAGTSVGMAMTHGRVAGKFATGQTVK
jgi:hypothetical protein